MSNARLLDKREEAIFAAQGLELDLPISVAQAAHIGVRLPEAASADGLAYTEQELVASSQRLVYGIAKRFWAAFEVNRSIREDVHQAGMLALCKAAKAFDPDKQSWAGFAAPCVFRAMAREVRKLLNPVGGRETATPFSRMGTADKDFVATLEAAETTGGALETADAVRAALDCKLLTSRDISILRRTYGIDCEAVKDATIAKEIGVSRARVVQLRQTALAKLHLARRFGH